MRKIRQIWRSAFDVREGERLRTLFMSLYLLAVLFAYYIVKPVSRAMFVDHFDIDRLPYLYILIAIVGGLLATLYTRVAVRASLNAAVAWATGISIVSLVGLWWLVQLKLPWMLYVFNIWTSLFGVVLVSQGWLVAANVFNTREAKRLYGLVGLGAVLGAWFGSAFTKFTVKLVGVENLLLACAALVIVSYVLYRLTVAQKRISIAGAKAAQVEEARFTSRDIIKDIGRNRHLQVITAIITITFIVDVIVEYQLQAAGKLVYKGAEAYSAFLSTYYFYQNVATFVLQLFFTGALVRKLGVGGTLQLMPVTIAGASAVSALWPGTQTAQVARLVEATDRYTFNRTGMELLYLPLPVELRNRTKAFVDIFVDRMGRGLGGMLLIALTWVGLTDLARLPWVVIVFCGVWVLLSIRAQHEYVRTVRRRLEARRFDLESARVTVGDPATLRLLEQAARGGNVRQACYALSVLGEAPGYEIRPLLSELVESTLPEVRSEVYRLARSARFDGLMGWAQAELPTAKHAGVRDSAVRYLLAVSPERTSTAREFLNSDNLRLAESTLAAIGENAGEFREVVTHEWCARGITDPDPERRRLAAIAIGVCGEDGREFLRPLIDDPAPSVAAAAFRTAGSLQNRSYLHDIVPKLADPRLRGAAIEALAAYGTRIVGTLSDLLEDDHVSPAIRKQIPRVLRAIQDQRSVDVLIRSINQPNLAVRAAVLKALNRLRASAPSLNYGDVFVTKQILNEARLYFELSAALAPFRGHKGPRTAAGLLAVSIEERLNQTLERLFRLLGLRYPPKEMYAAYLALNSRKREQYAAALEFLDNVLDRELKRILLPLLDDGGQLMERGRELFGVEIRTPEEAIRELIRSRDSWLVVCAMAAAGELRMRGLAAEITEAAKGAGAEVCQVAQAAQFALA